MRFPQPLISGQLIRRYKRFLADVTLQDGTVITAHTANTGAMLGCCKPGSRVWLSDSKNEKRKYPHTWELIEIAKTKEKVLAGINTQLANVLVKEAIIENRIKELQNYQTIRTEVLYGMERSRIDLLLHSEDQADCYVEVKNATLVKQDIAMFPDAVTKRGAKHLRELMQMVNEGCRAVLVFCVQRDDVACVQADNEIDPDYAQQLKVAAAAGVEVLAYSAKVNINEVVLYRGLEVLL